MPEFDIRATIKELAGWERVRTGTQSLEAPFAALRLVQPDGRSHLRCLRLGVCDWAALSSGWLPSCHGRGWIPEPDEEKAEFRALLVLARYDIARAQIVLADIGEMGIMGLALRAARAWMEEEQHDTDPSRNP